MRGLRCLPIALAAVGGPAFGSVLTLNSNSARECYLAADGEQRSSEAIATCDLAVAQFTGNSKTMVATLVNRGIVRLHRGDVAAALSDFDAAIAMEPDQAEAWLNKGMALLRQPERAGEAISAFGSALRHGTRRPALAHLARGYAYEGAGNIRAAYRDYKRAEALYPGWQLATRELRRFQVRGTGGGSGQGSR